MVTLPIAWSLVRHQANVRSRLEATRGCGFELFWIDAWWHRVATGWGRQLWFPDRTDGGA